MATPVMVSGITVFVAGAVLVCSGAVVHNPIGLLFLYGRISKVVLSIDTGCPDDVSVNVTSDVSVETSIGRTPNLASLLMGVRLPAMALVAGTAESALNSKPMRCMTHVSVLAGPLISPLGICNLSTACCSQLCTTCSRRHLR